MTPSSSGDSPLLHIFDTILKSLLVLLVVLISRSANEYNGREGLLARDNFECLAESGHRLKSFILILKVQ